MSQQKLGSLVQFRNCRILRNHRIYTDDLWVRDGKIVNPEKVFFDEKIPADVQVDCQNTIIAPGFIDVQLNGAFGVDFSDTHGDIVAGVRSVAKRLLEHGVTSFCPTVITSPPDVYQKILPKIVKCPGSAKGAGVLGTHVEGPFISPEMKGAHPEKYIQALQNGFQDLINTYHCMDSIVLITLAPEFPHSMEVIKKCVAQGITVSLGTKQPFLVLFESPGLLTVNRYDYGRHGDHLPQCFHHRDPHLVGLLTSEKIPKDRTIYYGLISDGVHTHPAALRIAHRVHPDGLVLVTDAMRAMGLQEGTYRFGSQSVEIRGKNAFLTGTNTLAGSIARMDVCVRHFAKATGCGAVLALEAASLHPAQMLGITQSKGTLNFGADADFILLNDSLEVMATYIAGELVWKHEEFL